MNKVSYSIKKRAKSFFWASVFFNRIERKDIEILYSFCRYIDDIGDSKKFSTSNSKKKLLLIIKDLSDFKSQDSIISDFLIISKKYKINKEVPIDLINGVIKDLKKKIDIKTFSELITYSYQVAGTVGIMMCNIMNVKNRELFKHAVQLGIAMQLTNIARDIKEDLLMNRIYFPKDFRNFLLSSSYELITNKNKQKIFSKDLHKIIMYSDILYAQALYGIEKLPFKHRFPIMLASNLYQRIGFKIKCNTQQIWNKRIYVTFIEKIFITFNCFISSVFLTSTNKVKIYNTEEIEDYINGLLLKIR
ncbi:squalene/phytoene synthase family protein [Rickettsiales bacterium]|nr:squalene/phytoene synthase family protein [Rickettsiales bacterium]